MKYGIIYRAFYKDGRSYIGQTVKFLEERKKEHFYNSKYKKSHFHIALQKYGFDSFTWEILDEGESKEELDLKEIKWIEYYDSFNNGFNKRTGGSRGLLSDDIKQQIGQKNKGENNGMFGKLAWNNGKSLTKEHVENLSESHKGQIPWNKGRSGYKTKPCSEEKKQIIAKANKGENNGKAKFTWEQIREIREMKQNGKTNKEIAEIFSANLQTIRDITSYRRWKE